MESFQRQISEEVTSVTLGRIVLVAVIAEVSVRSQRNETNGDSGHEEDGTLGEGQDVFFDASCCGFSVLILGIFDGKNLIDWHDDVTKNIVFGDDVGVGLSSVDDDKLVGILIVPDDPVNSIRH